MDELIIRNYLYDNSFTFHILDTVDSTSTFLRELYENGARNKTVAIANEQTNGRGRKGKKFFSPADAGIYMSVLIKPDFPLDKPAIITTSAAVSVCRAIKKVLNIQPQIKWVNDIYIDNKKVCGILTESITSFQNPKKKAIILGIGINIFKPNIDYPPEILDIAAPIIKDDCIIEGVKERLVAEILNEFSVVLYSDRTQIYSEYKKMLFLIGKKIRVLSLEDYDAEVLDLAKDYSLIIKKENGDIINLFSGEISINVE